jgi:hypothetical protein
VSFVSPLIILTLVALQPTQPAAELPPDPASIDTLIAQLADDDWQQRQRAQDRLVMLGGEASTLLERAAGESPDPEVRERAAAALARIEQNAETGPSIITIKGDDLLVGDVFKQLSEQCGVPLESYPPDLLDQQRGAKVSLDIDHLPFWDAMRQISEKTGFTLQQWDNTGVKLMQGGQHSEGVSQVSGAYLISAIRVSRSRFVELGGGQGAYEDFQVLLGARAEPKLRLLRVAYAPNLEEATDDRGNSLLPEPSANAAAAGGYAIAPGGAWQLPARLSAPANMGRRIARLRGSFDVSIQTRAEQLDVPDIVSARGVNKVAGGVRFVIKELRRNGDGWTLDMLARLDGARPDEWERIQQTLSTADIRLLDERGEAFQRTGSSSSGGPEQVEMSIEFSPRAAGQDRKLGEPSKLVWTVPTETRDLSVPFDFKDLPIP